MTFFVLQSFLGFSTRRQRGRECVRLLSDRSRLESLLRRGKRLGYCAGNVPTVVDLFDIADEDFFMRLNQL